MDTHNKYDAFIAHTFPNGVEVTGELKLILLDMCYFRSESLLARLKAFSGILPEQVRDRILYSFDWKEVNPANVVERTLCTDIEKLLKK
jgi:hypothetical protein